MIAGIKAIRLTTPTLTGVKGDNNGVTVTWNKVSGAAKYRVFRKTGYGNWQRVGDTTALTYTDTTAKVGTQYVYTVRCITSDGKVYTSGHSIAGITGQCAHTHTWDSGTETTAATCEEDGVQTYTCTVCGQTKTESIPALSHNWDNGTVTTAATCEEDGVQTYTCTVCGQTKTESIPALGHDWDNGTVTTAATCEEDGVQTYTCTVCGQTKTESIPALGHNWVSDGTKTITVIDKAAWDEEVIIIDKAEWDETVTVTDKAAYDEVITVVDKEAWDEKEMVSYFVCKDCGHEEPGTADGTTKMGDHIFANLDSHPKGGYTTKYRYETVHHDAETHTETIHHDAVTHTETVSTGYTCTHCGAHKD